MSKVITLDELFNILDAENAKLVKALKKCK